MEFFWYIVCSTVESCAFFIVMLFLFRFHSFQYIRSIFATSVLFSFLSYSLRVDLGFNNFFPLVTILVFAVYAFYILKIPLFWAVAMSLVSTITSFALETLMLLLYFIPGVGTLGDISSTSSRIFQVLYAIIVIPLSYFMYRRGIGFAFNFDKLKWRAENLVVFIIVIILVIAMFITFIQKNVFYAIVFALITTAFLLYLSFKKERDDID
ncbi:hypothetical protein ACFPVX_18200 [Cohnella faecalis]|uniref:Uncharacterized protein n=1 Tax=Cohnella faecalis TaxID=2315694 RepID=A0A398CH21_9BACL|nr:hypothetical protein [Cohnella faecalis]RIE01262.1 hypothetical protein D3H35_23015 [Cohnella faecalis]